MNGKFVNGNFKNTNFTNRNRFRRIDAVYVNIDGASKGNPGPAAIGVIVKDNWGKILEEYKEFIGKSTNNFAEYKAAIRGLELAMKYCRNKVYIFTDSKLLVNQLNGRYRIRKDELRKLLMEIKMLEGFYRNVRWFHVEREKNGKADFLANSALNGKKEFTNQSQNQTGNGLRKTFSA